MYNIKFAGIYKDEKQLRHADNCAGSIKYKEPKTIEQALVQGMLVFLPSLFILLVMTGYFCMDMIMSGVIARKDFVFSIIITSILLIVGQFVHEIIHALCFPLKYLKEIYISENMASMFVYVTEPVTRERFILIAFAPNIILGIIPFVAGVIFRDYFMPIVVMSLILFGSIMIICGVGDYMNIYNTIRQVPVRGKVYNDGLHSYWYSNDREQKKEKDKSNFLMLAIIFFSCGCFLVSMYRVEGLLLFFISSLIALLDSRFISEMLKYANVFMTVIALLIFGGVL